VRQLAVLHAQGTRLAETVGSRPQWLCTYPEWWRRSLSVVGVKRSHLRGIAAAVDNGVVPASLRDRGQDLWRVSAIGAGASRPTADADPRRCPPRQLVRDRRRRDGLCDWQCVSVGHWSRDLAYALASTLDIEQRRTWESELIEAYLDQLREGASPTSALRPPGRCTVANCLVRW